MSRKKREDQEERTSLGYGQTHTIAPKSWYGTQSHANNCMCCQKCALPDAMQTATYPKVYRRLSPLAYWLISRYTTRTSRHGIFIRYLYCDSVNIALRGLRTSPLDHQVMAFYIMYGKYRDPAQRSTRSCTICRYLFAVMHWLCLHCWALRLRAPCSTLYLRKDRIYSYLRLLYGPDAPLIPVP